MSLIYISQRHDPNLVPRSLVDEAEGSRDLGTRLTRSILVLTKYDKNNIIEWAKPHSKTGFSVTIENQAKHYEDWSGILNVLWAFTIWMEFSVIPGRIQMERFIPVENFRKKGNTFRGISFPCFYRNSRKFLYHLSILTSARLLAVKLPRKKAKDLKDSGRFPKRLSSQCVSSLVGSVGGRLRTQLQPCRWKRIKFCGRYLCFSFTYVIRASSVLPHELHWGKTMWMPIADFPDVRWMLKQPNRWNCRLFSKKY